MTEVLRRAQNSAERPQTLAGSLHSELHLVLQTRQAQLLVRGRTMNDKPRITGLIAFSDRLRLIWQAAEEDDPFADWWLVKIHEALSAAEARIETEINPLKLQLRSTRTMHIAPAEVKEPFRIALRFSTPYAYRAARMLGEFDELACCAFTAKHIGMLNNDQCHTALRSSARRIRAAFNLPLRFRRLGVMRGPVFESHPSFERAEELMGVLPKDVLSGERRAPLAPTIRGIDARAVPPVISESVNDDVVFD